MRTTTHPLWIALVVAVSALGCARQPLQSDSHNRVGLELQSLVEAAVADHDAVPAAALYVRVPSIELEWQGAAGAADPTTGDPMTPDHPVRIASNTKTYIASSVLRLWEDGRLGLDEPIADLLPADVVELLHGDGYRPGDIRVRHLLTHTAGLYDYADRVVYTDAIIADPTHRWTRREQLQAAVDWGDPVAPPGQVYNYSDTAYILLGSILEQITGDPMPTAVRELLGYARLGLRSTWFETLEPRPDNVPDLVHQFTGDIDSTTIDASVDLYGGGGIVTSIPELGRFTHALFTGRVFEQRDTLDTMLTTFPGLGLPIDGEVSRLPAGAYRMGVWVAEVNGLTAYWHTGFWGTAAVHVPSIGVTVAAAVTQNREGVVLDELVSGAVRTAGETH
jgi:D-alanyl-D-alanine carboxypeptidase